MYVSWRSPGRSNKIVPPNFNKGTYKHGCAMEGEDVFALRVEEGTQQLFVDTSEISEGKMVTAVDG